MDTVPEYMSFAEFKKNFFANTNQHYFPVVNKKGELVGIFSNTDFRSILFAEGVEHLIIVKDIATTDIITTNFKDDLQTVMKKIHQKKSR